MASAVTVALRAYISSQVILCQAEKSTKIMARRERADELEPDCSIVRVRQFFKLAIGTFREQPSANYVYGLESRVEHVTDR